MSSKSTVRLSSYVKRQLPSNEIKHSTSSTQTKVEKVEIKSIRPSSTAEAMKSMSTYRRDVDSNLSPYDEFAKVQAISSSSNSVTTHPDPYPSSSRPCPPDSLHLVPQINTLSSMPLLKSTTAKITSSTPIKHLLHPTKTASADAHHLEEMTPRGKAAALLGMDIESTHKYKAVDTSFGPRATSTATTTIISASGRASSKSTNSRRNSDPSSNKIPLLDVNRGNDMYQSSTHINIAGHRFHKVSRIGKGEKCASCQENDAFVNEGHRCLDCKLLVHTKCIQNGGVKTLHCEAKRSKRQTRKNYDKTPTTPAKYGSREYTDSTDKIISDAKELQQMQDFIAQKIYKMDVDCKKPSAVDRVFKQALREFKDNLVAQYSLAHKQKSDMLNIKYRDLISNFEQVMDTCCGNKKDDFPLTMGVNAFRGFLNEFMTSRENEKPKAKRKKEKKRKPEEHTNYNGHIFQLTIINIPTACEICQLFLLWPIERGLVSVL